MPIDYVRLSKTISRALRHAPDRFGLSLDSEGWTPISDLLAALRRHRREWQTVTEDDLDRMLAQANKQRFEIRDGRIRAYYGHSLDQIIQHEPAIPPDSLYHGTTPYALAAIRQDGLRPMSRQYVHLSTTEQTARMVGSRRTDTPVILRIDARAAHTAGIAFYHGNEDIWLSDAIPPQFISESPDNP